MASSRPRAPLTLPWPTLRTSLGQAVESGECLLEWDYSKGAPPAPILKDVFGSERRKAKTLNFSIAYGKTTFGAHRPPPERHRVPPSATERHCVPSSAAERHLSAFPSAA